MQFYGTPKCIAQTARGAQCQRRGLISVEGGAVCLIHSSRGYIPFAPSEVDESEERRMHERMKRVLEGAGP